jgi:hypothetical protein
MGLAIIIISGHIQVPVHVHVPPYLMWCVLMEERAGQGISGLQEEQHEHGDMAVRGHFRSELVFLVISQNFA